MHTGLVARSLITSIKILGAEMHVTCMLARGGSVD